MKLLYLLVCTQVSVLASPVLEEDALPLNVCRRLEPPRVDDACELHEAFDKMDPCVQDGKQIYGKEDCEASSCCWSERNDPRCFAKPKKCYVDLRWEKCFKTLQPFDRIYTGHSINGTFCRVSSIAYTPEELGQTRGGDFPIFSYTNNSFPPCLDSWEYMVRNMGNGKCEIDIVIPRNATLKGELFFNQSCVIRGRFPFPFQTFAQLETHCTCTTDAWLQSDDEVVSISEDVKTYIENRESLSTCTQVLGMITRLSWRNRIVLINREEVDEVMNALSELSQTEKIKQLTTNDAKAILNTTRKVAQYPFYEKLDNASATELMKKTTFVISKIIESVVITKQEPKLQMSHSDLDDVFKYDVDVIVDKSPEFKHEVFHTLDTMSKTVASRVVPLKNNSNHTFRAIENHVDLSMVITQSNDAHKLLNNSHFSENSDLVSVLGVDPIKGKLEKAEPTDSGADNIALITVFYDYSPGHDDERISKYLSVNVRQFVGGGSRRLSVPVKFTLTRDETEDWPIEMIPTCAFLGSNITREDWQFYGCKTTNHPSSNKTTCECNHTTNFAVLMKFTPSELLGIHDKTLQILSLILGIISIGSLIITLFVFINHRKRLLKERMIIHFQLIIALLFGYISLLISSLFASNTTKVFHPACLFCAISTHFFFLAVFFFSLAEGIYLFYKIVMVFRQRWASSVPRFSPIIGWFLPFVIVIVSFSLSRTFERSSAGMDTYADSRTCFLAKENYMIWAYAGPVLFVISVNLMVLAKVSLIVFKSSYTSSRLSSVDEATRIGKSLKRASKGALLLMPILGVPTIVSLLYNFYIDDTTGTKRVNSTWLAVGTVGAYLQVILTGIQGFLIFIFYCYFNAEVRAAYELATRRQKSVGNLQALKSSKRQMGLPWLARRSGSSAGSGEIDRNQRSTSISKMSSFRVSVPLIFRRSSSIPENK